MQTWPLGVGALSALVGLWGLALASCGGGGDLSPAGGCVPTCGERECGDDGCGASCGTCTGPAHCDESGSCVADPRADASDAGPSAAASCEEAGFDCGSYLGASCGTCAGAQRVCVDHHCVCAPSCTVDTCEEPDGCGGACPACPRDLTCSDCALSLSVVDREIQGGVVRAVTVALDFTPAPNSPLPGMADLRLALSGDAELSQVAVGEALLSAGKQLAADPETGRPYRVIEPQGDGGDEIVQLLVLSTANTNPIPAGRWLFLTFRLGPFQQGHGAPTVSGAPMTLSLGLVKREAIFAPADADAALWGADFGTPLVVWSDDIEVNHAP